MTHSLLVVGSYAAADQPGIRLLRLDHGSGQLTACGSYAGIRNPSFVALHPSRRWLYAVSETGQAEDGASGAVWAMRLTGQPLGIEPISSQPSGGDQPCHVQLDATGRWLIVSNYGSGTVAVLPIQPDGALGPISDLVRHHGRSIDPQRQAGPHTHSTIRSPDNRHVIVADLGLDQLVVYSFDAVAGTLRPHGQTATRPGAGPRHMAFQPSGQQLYVVNELDNTVAVYSFDAGAGLLHERQTLPTLPSDAPSSAAADIHIAPSGRYLYVSNRGRNSITVFEIQPDGQLRRGSTVTCGGDWPRNFALVPGDQLMLVANQRSDEITVLPLLPDGTPGAALARSDVPGAACVQLLPAAD